MNLPEPIKTNITDESFAGVTYHIRGAWCRSSSSSSPARP
jgi:hypothetical protein